MRRRPRRTGRRKPDAPVRVLRHGAMTGNGRKHHFGAIFSHLCGSSFIRQLLLCDGKNLPEFRTFTFSCILNYGSFVGGFRRTRSLDQVWILPALFLQCMSELDRTKDGWKEADKEDSQASHRIHVAWDCSQFISSAGGSSCQWQVTSVLVKFGPECRMNLHPSLLQDAVPPSQIWPK